MPDEETLRVARQVVRVVPSNSRGSYHNNNNVQRSNRSRNEVQSHQNKVSHARSGRMAPPIPSAPATRPSTVPRQPAPAPPSATITKEPTKRAARAPPPPSQPPPVNQPVIKPSDLKQKSSQQGFRLPNIGARPNQFGKSNLKIVYSLPLKETNLAVSLYKCSLDAVLKLNAMRDVKNPRSK